MGNVLVSSDQQNFLPLDGSLTGVSIALAWLSISAYLIIRWLVLEPWGYKSVARSLIDENEKARLARFNTARAKCEDLNESVRDEILGLEFFQLREALQKDKYNAQTVLKAYTWKALQVQGKINCLAEYLIEAFEKAEALDEKYSGKPNKPPLYGLPFSVKGNFFIKDYPCCVGLSKFLHTKEKRDCTFVTLLHELGAVPFVLTNVPQALLSYVCSNAVYGTTGNPRNHDRTPGGSSGGEASLLASRGTPFATGSDLAGSIRIPATMCGVVGLKPTEARISVRYCVGGIPGKARMALGVGVLTHTVEEQTYLLDAILKSDYFYKTAPKAIPLPLNRNLVEETAKKTLKIGYFFDDGFLKPTPGCARVVRETVEKLKLQGHELVKFELPRPYEAAEFCYKAIATDGGGYLCKLYKNDLVDQHLTNFVTLLNLPLWVRYIGSFVVGAFSPQAKVIARAYERSIESLRIAHENVDNYTEQIFDMFNEMGIDALICPAFTVPPIPHKYPQLLTPCGFSTALWNMVDFPAGVVPVGEWTEQDDRDLQDESVWPVGNNFVLKMMREAAANSTGLPLAVQVVARPYQEEVCLGVMEQVEKAFKKN